MLICPYCQNDLENQMWDLHSHEEECEDLYCPFCEKEITICMQKRITYSIYKTEDTKQGNYED